jgi:hypothetical protein
MDENNPITPPAEVYCNDGAMTADVTTTAPSTLDALSDPLTSVVKLGVAGDPFSIQEAELEPGCSGDAARIRRSIGTPPNNDIATAMPICPAVILLPLSPPAEGTATDSWATLVTPFVPGMAADGNRLLLPINMRFKPVDRGRPPDIVWTLLSSSTISYTSVHDSFQQLWKDVIDAIMAPNV